MPDRRPTWRTTSSPYDRPPARPWRWALEQFDGSIEIKPMARPGTCMFADEEMVVDLPGPTRERQSYRHEAFLWRDPSDFVTGMVPFIRDGLAADEAVMVALPSPHAGWLRAALGGVVAKVQFVDMAELGRNPARIIPAWQDFLAEQSGYGRPARGIGEPIWAGRRPEELSECQLHEALLNLAVDPELPFWLVCPYDVEHLDDTIIAEAHRSHPVISGSDFYYGSRCYGGQAHADALFTTDLPAIPGEPQEYTAASHTVDEVFAIVAMQAILAGLWSDAVVDLAEAVRRLARKSLASGARLVEIRIWDRPEGIVCEVADPNRVQDLLVGRRAAQARTDQLWWVNGVCDLVQVRSNGSGTTIRLHAWKGS